MKQNKQRERFLETLGMIGVVLAVGNAYGAVYLLGEWMLYGYKPTGWALFPIAVTAGIVEVIAARKIAREIAKLTAPKREGIIPAETICKIMNNQNNKTQEAK